MREVWGSDLIAEERARQIAVEGWTSEHDDGHQMAEMSLAALSYLSLSASQVRMHGACLKNSTYWPWDEGWWKPSDDPIRNLVKAGALIAAEIDRLLRKQEKHNA